MFLGQAQVLLIFSPIVLLHLNYSIVSRPLYVLCNVGWAENGPLLSTPLAKTLVLNAN